MIVIKKGGEKVYLAVAVRKMLKGRQIVYHLGKRKNLKYWLCQLNEYRIHIYNYYI